jgi:hypothetical protein
MALGLTHPLAEMSTRDFRGVEGGKALPTCKADNLTSICEPTVWKIWNPVGVHGLLQG